jgi:hypothetical protein
MKLTVDFSALHKAIAPLGAVIPSFSITKRGDAIDSVARDLVLGIDIQLDEIDGSDGVLGYDGHQVMLYIPDQGQGIDAALIDGKGNRVRRVHIAECRTIVEMRGKGRFHNHYIVTSRIDGKFKIFGRSVVSNEDLEGEADLSPCINCMKALNVKGYLEKSSASQKNFIAHFSFGELFESYSSLFETMPITTVDYYSGGYTSDWASISSNLKSELNYTCEYCGVNLDGNSKLLHAHHINGNKADNKRQNLRVLCADCHKKQPHHGHLYVSNEHTLMINNLRKEQKIAINEYSRLLVHADSALIGIVSKCKKYRLPCPEIGEVKTLNGKEVSIDLCWSKKKVALVINKESRRILRAAGWTVYKVSDAINSFDLLQSEVR